MITNRVELFIDTWDVHQRLKAELRQLDLPSVLADLPGRVDHSAGGRYRQAAGPLAGQQRRAVRAGPGPLEPRVRVKHGSIRTPAGYGTLR